LEWVSSLDDVGVARRSVLAIKQKIRRQKKEKKRDRTLSKDIGKQAEAKRQTHQ
jgi:hypothetical protein